MDDDEGSALGLSGLLEQLGYETMTATSGRQGLRLASAFLPAVAFLDLQMPDKPGLEVARELHDQHPDIHLVAVSGSGMEAEAREAGFAAYFAKPLDLERFETEFALGAAPRFGRAA